jgi:ABC-type transport system substrate-binding protein
VLRRVLAAVVVAATASVVLTVQGAGATGPGNVDLKRPVNYAIDRQAMLEQRGAHPGVVNDQILPQNFPGFADAALYPTRPDVERARALAGWRPGDPMRRAVMYTCNAGPCIPTAQIVQANLAQIGIEVEI